MRMFRSLWLLFLLGACDTDSDADDGALAPDAAVIEPADASVDVDADRSPRPVTIRFAPVVGSAPFACGLTYVGQGTENTTITPRDFRFYYHDVVVLTADGTRVPVTLDQDGAWQSESVGLIDFEDFTAGCDDGTPETNRTIRGTVPPGAYTGLAFTIGVPEAMNHTDLTTKPAPLNTSGLWWSWNFGHLFFVAVSHTEITMPTPGTNDHHLHVGSTGCTGDAAMGQAVTCAKRNRPTVELGGFDPLSQAIAVDFGAVLAASPLTTSTGCHSFQGATCTAPFQQLGLDFATGAPVHPQQVFRVAP